MQSLRSSWPQTSSPIPSTGQSPLPTQAEAGGLFSGDGITGVSGLEGGR